ncbi:MAG TPA: YsnF/AvaK domain-containing protein, partial [Paenibacillus sp.]|nr:YsnF/AvaK domain-containing protein [Paenibacillus sp.]
AIVLRRRPNRSEASATASLRLREERLDIRKERVVTGDVAIRREVVEEKRTIEVPVRREEVVIERTSVPSGDPDGAATETIRIPVKEERIDIVKTPVDLEDVSVYTRPVEELREAKATVRREELRVERIGQTGESPESSEEQHP